MTNSELVANSPLQSAAATPTPPPALEVNQLPTAPLLVDNEHLSLTRSRQGFEALNDFLDQLSTSPEPVKPQNPPSSSSSSLSSIDLNVDPNLGQLLSPQLGTQLSPKQCSRQRSLEIPESPPHTLVEPKLPLGVTSQPLVPTRRTRSTTSSTVSSIATRRSKRNK